MQKQKEFSKIIQSLNSEPGLILLHHNADIDSVGSAIALQSAFPNLSIGANQNISHLSKNMVSHFEDIEIHINPEIDQKMVLVILDTSSPIQLDIEPANLDNAVIIDHHKKNSNLKNEIYYCDETKSSCSEIIFELLEFMKFKITRKTALALLAGIVADTGNFRYANIQSFKSFINLLEQSNLTMGEVLKIFNNIDTQNISQRIAHLKGAQRLKFKQYSNLLIVISQLSSYEASMSKNLIILGADVAFVGAQRGENVRISGRASSELVKLGLHLGTFLQKISAELSCEGGGHAGAAGMNGIGDVEMMLNACMNGVIDLLKDIA